MNPKDLLVLRNPLRPTDLPYSKWWGAILRFGKTLEVAVYRAAQALFLYRPHKSIVGVPALATPNYTSIQAVVYSGTQEEVLGYRPRGAIHRFLRGLPDVEMFESVRFDVSVSSELTKTIEASTETRGFVYLQLPWALPWRPETKSTLKMTPMGVETLVGRIPVGNYDVFECPVYFLTEQVKFVVVSDIDDTIKESNIGQTTSLSQIVRGIFRGGYYTYKPIEGMAELYRSIAEKGGMVIYLTSTPIQLAPFLLKFLRDAGFPEGPVFLRWLGINRFGHKWRMLHRILNNTEGRKIFLIGDSGEQDLQIYRRICENEVFAEKIQKILIRHVPGTPLPTLTHERETLYNDMGSLRAHLDDIFQLPS